MTPEMQAAFDQLQTSMAKQKERMEAVPGNHFLLWWHDCPLRTDGDIVSLVGGDKVYTMASKVLMQREADRFNDSLKEDDEKVEVLMVGEAIARHVKISEETISKIKELHK